MSPKTVELTAQKKALRSYMRRALRDVSGPARRSAESIALHFLQDFLTREQARCGELRVALYASRTEEFSTRELDDWLMEAGIHRVVPTIAGAELRFVDVAADERIHDFPLAQWGIPTPPDPRPETELAACHGILVPGLAFDPQGGRLGYGKGFYDRSLCHVRRQRPAPWTLALHYDVQLVDTVPMSPWDERIELLCSAAHGLRATHRALKSGSP